MTDTDRPSQRWTDDELQELDTGTDKNDLKIKRDPISKFTDEKATLGRADNYIGKLERNLTEFEAYLYHEHDEHICNVSYKEILAFNKFLRGDTNRSTFYTITDRNGNPKEIDLADTNRHQKIQYLRDLYGWLINEDVVSTNPAETALTKLDDDEFDLTPPSRPRKEMFEMREFLQWISNPLIRSFIMLLLKTGARLGQAANLDLCDIHIDHPLYYDLLDEVNVDLHDEVVNKPDSIYFRPGFQEDTEIRGEVRALGSKTKRRNGCVIPIDDELKTALLEYILVRRKATKHTPESKPFFVKHTLHGDLDRLTKDAVYGLLTVKNDTSGCLKEYGWYEQGAPTADNVTVHFFRHFFTHNHKPRKGVYRDYIPEPVRRYVRGDVPKGNSAEDINYDHDDWNVWTEFIKKPYLDAIYKFNIYD